MSEGEGAHPGLGFDSPGSREAEGEGGEGFISPKAAGANLRVSLRGRRGSGMRRDVEKVSHSLLWRLKETLHAWRLLYRSYQKPP